MSDGREKDGVFHFDFFNGWKEGVLQNIIDRCPIIDGPYEADNYNPPCGCEEFLTEAPNPGGEVCDSNVKALILNEETRVVQGQLPTGTCEGPTLVPKSWARNENPPVTCSVTSVPEPDDEEDDGEEEEPDEEPEEPDEEPDEPDEELDDLSCDEECQDAFITCENDIDEVCGENFLQSCESECQEEFADDDEELEACTEEWCGEDQEVCFDRETRRCRRRRRKCFRAC